MIHDLPSIVDRIDLNALFIRQQPLEVELGCGDALFLADYAASHPGTIFWASSDCWAGCANWIAKVAPAGWIICVGWDRKLVFLEWLLPPDSVAALHLYFPDPWPKLKHRKHRLVNERFLTLIWPVLRPGSLVYLRTDDENYFQQMTRVFQAVPRFISRETPTKLAAVQTDFGANSTHAAFPPTVRHTSAVKVHTSITGPLPLSSSPGFNREDGAGDEP